MLAGTVGKFLAIVYAGAFRYEICQAALPLEAPRMRTLHALTAHSLRTQNMV